MRLSPRVAPDELARDQQDSSRVRNNTVIVGIILTAFIFLVVLTFLFLRHLRRSPTPPRFLPAFIARRLIGTSAEYSTPLEQNSSGNNAANTSNLPQTSQLSSAHTTTTTTTTTGDVNRNTSVRSIMTLPEYRPQPLADHERTIAREGERAGMDVVIEGPETVEESEQRRDAHMQTLYEIRTARAVDREARRLRREERRSASGSSARTLAVSGAGRDRTVSSSSLASLVPPQSSASGGGGRGGGAITSSLLAVEAGVSSDRRAGRAGRERSSSATSQMQQLLAARNAPDLATLLVEPPTRLPQLHYADIGTARPDGTRVDSSTSLPYLTNTYSADREGLLSAAAAMGEDGGGSARASLGSFEDVNVRGGRLSEGDLGAPNGGAHSWGRPPEYDRLMMEMGEAPAYESPVIARGERPMWARSGDIADDSGSGRTDGVTGGTDAVSGNALGSHSGGWGGVHRS